MPVYNFTKHSHSLQLVKNNNILTALDRGGCRAEENRGFASACCIREDHLDE